MTTTSDFMFNNMGRIGSDVTDNSQRNISNERYSSYLLNNYFNNSDDTVRFATLQPTVNFRGNGGGSGLSGSVIDNESNLSINSNKSREFEKLQLFQRPYLTVPYLGKGSNNPDLESQLLQGELTSDKKSIATISTLPYIDYSTYPLMDSVKNRMNDPKYSVEEIGLDGFVRGGTSSREKSSISNKNN